MEKFQTVITPKNRLFDLHLGELWRYRDLVVLFVRRTFVSQYKQTILGPVWAIIQPLLTTVVFTLVFGNIAGLAAEGIPRLCFTCPRRFYGHIFLAASRRRQTHLSLTAM